MPRPDDSAIGWGVTEELMFDLEAIVNSVAKSFENRKPSSDFAKAFSKNSTTRPTVGAKLFWSKITEAIK